MIHHASYVKISSLSSIYGKEFAETLQAHCEELYEFAPRKDILLIHIQSVVEVLQTEMEKDEKFINNFKRLCEETFEVERLSIE